MATKQVEISLNGKVIQTFPLSDEVMEISVQGETDGFRVRFLNEVKNFSVTSRRRPRT